MKAEGKDCLAVVSNFLPSLAQDKFGRFRDHYELKKTSEITILRQLKLGQLGQAYPKTLDWDIDNISV